MFECINFKHCNDNEAQCCVSMWMRNPDNIMKEATLWLEELHGQPVEAWHFTDVGSSEDRQPRNGPMRVLSNDILVHLDQVVDFRPSVMAGASGQSATPSSGGLAFTMGACGLLCTAPSRTGSGRSNMIGRPAMMGQMMLVVGPAIPVTAVRLAILHDDIASLAMVAVSKGVHQSKSRPARQQL
jgi:hypothetical protein